MFYYEGDVTFGKVIIMLSKLKSIFNNIKNRYEGSKMQAVWRQKKVLCKKAVLVFQNIINMVAKKLTKIGVSANVVTITGFIIGIFAINFLSLERYAYALICILINRVFDALDGAIARNTKVTDFGVFLDAALDYTFYAGVIFGFALANPFQNAVAAAFLLFAFAAAACAMLAYAVVAYKNNASQKLELNQSPFYLGGFAQGFETLAAFLILCIVPGWFLQIAIVLGILCLVKAFSIMVTAYYNFVIAKRIPKE